MFLRLTFVPPENVALAIDTQSIYNKYEGSGLGYVHSMREERYFSVRHSLVSSCTFFIRQLPTVVTLPVLSSGLRLA